MATTERVTVTLPKQLLASVDRLESNRSRFVSEAVARELERRRSEALLESVRNPHPETADFTEAGFDAWAHDLEAADTDLLRPSSGATLRWVDGQGWIEGPE